MILQAIVHVINGRTIAFALVVRHPAQGLDLEQGPPCRRLLLPTFGLSIVCGQFLDGRRTMDGWFCLILMFMGDDSCILLLEKTKYFFLRITQKAFWQCEMLNCQSRFRVTGYFVAWYPYGVAFFIRIYIINVTTRRNRYIISPPWGLCTSC